MLRIGALLSEQENFGDDDKDVASEIEDYDDDNDECDDTDDDEEEEPEEWVIWKDSNERVRSWVQERKFFMK